MIDYDEQGLFDGTKERVADAISTLVDDGTHPALVYAAMMSIISEAITTEGFWGDEVSSFTDLRGYWNVMWRLTQKTFTELATASQR